MNIKQRLLNLESKTSPDSTLVERLNEVRDGKCQPAPLATYSELTNLIASSHNPLEVRIARARLRIGQYIV
ncbi:MAG: hypothetical protein WCK96_17140 [Methylococcales bacterium]